MRELHIVCTRIPTGPGQPACELVEIEDETGASVGVGDWRTRANGLAEYVIKLRDRGVDVDLPPPGPDHPLVGQLENQWFKLFAIAMFAQHQTELRIPATTIARMPEGLTIVCDEILAEGAPTLRLRLLPHAEAAAIAARMR